MSFSNAELARSTVVGIQADAESVPSSGYTPLLEVADTNLPDITVDSKEVTHFLSPDGFKEFIFGWANGGEVSIEGNYIDSDRGTLDGYIQSYRWLEVDVAGTGSGYRCRVFITKLEAPIKNENPVTGKVTFKVTGKPVKFTAAP